MVALDNSQFALLLLSVLFVLSTLTVILRCYSRWAVLKKFGLDDKLAVGSCIANICASSIWIVVLSGVKNTQPKKLSMAIVIRTLKLTWAVIPFNQLILLFIQLSYLAFYTRFMMNTAYKILIVVACFITIQNIIFTFLSMFRCYPVDKLWDLKRLNHNCLSAYNVFGAQAVVNMVCDLTIYLLPVPSVYNLRISKRRKWSVIVLFMLGIIVLGASVWRLYTLLHSDYTTSGGKASFAPMIASALECNLAIIISCIPAIKPLFVRTFNIKSTEDETFRVPLSTFRLNGGQSQTTPVRLESAEHIEPAYDPRDKTTSQEPRSDEVLGADESVMEMGNRTPAGSICNYRNMPKPLTFSPDSDVSCYIFTVQIVL